MSDGSPTIDTLQSRLTELEGSVADMLISLQKLRPQVVTPQRLTEIRTAITAGAGFRLKQEELLDMMAVCTKVFFVLQKLEED